MTDPRDTMLTAARALHDRDPDKPDICGTCSDSDWRNTVTWPCPTAVALGATGRSEWAVPATAAAVTPDPRCTHQGNQGRCILNAGHRPGHMTSTGDYPQCRSMRWGLNCVMADGHLHGHFNIDGVRWGGCDGLRLHGGQSYPCVLEDGHEYGHRDQVGETW